VLDSQTKTDWQARVGDATASGLPNGSGTISAPDANGVATITLTWRVPSRKANEQTSQYITQVVIPP